MADPIVSVRRLTIAYGAVHAVRDVSFDLVAGGMAALSVRTVPARRRY